MDGDAARLCLRPGEFRSGHSVTLLKDGAQAYPRMLEAIEAARRSIFLEMYIFADDVAGHRFAKALAARAQAGVDVRVLYDAAGSKDTPREFFGWMRQQGVRVLEFNPLPRFLQGFRFRRRNHRKLLAVDDRIAFVGGMNVAREYAAPAEGGLGWRDTQIEIHGPVVADLGRMALEIWAQQRGTATGRLPPPEPPAEGSIPVLALSSHRFLDRWEIGRHYRHAIRHARKRIWIANPYFMPSIGFRRDLRRAAARGVDVRLLAPEHSDVPPALFATQYLFARLLRWGLRLFLWPGPMMHAKTAVIDGAWTTIGSYNIDHLSLMHNYELTAILADPAFGREVEAMFEDDFGKSREVRPEDWKRRGWGRRAMENLFYSLRFFF
jgi:cardiolipin synthase